MNRTAPARRSRRRPSRLQRQVRTVAVTTQMQKHHVSHRPHSRPRINRRQQFRRLVVRQVAPPTQVPRNQVRRTSRIPLQLDIMIEFQSQQVHVCQVLGHPVVPVPRIGQIPHRRRPLLPRRSPLNPEPERRTPVVAQLDRLHPQPHRRQKRPVVKMPNQPLRLQPRKGRKPRQPHAMPLVAVQEEPGASATPQSRHSAHDPRACASATRTQPPPATHPPPQSVPQALSDPVRGRSADPHPRSESEPHCRWTRWRASKNARA